MSSPESKLRTHLANAESGFDGLRRKVKARLGWMDPLFIQPYRTFGKEGSLWLRGRVLEDKGLGDHDEDAGLLKNVRDAFHRYESDEMPGAKLEVQLGGASLELETDEEGFFDVTVDSTQDVSLESPWTRIPLKLLEPLVDDQEPHETEALVRVPSADAAFGVISDMDDTVIRTGATHFLKRLRVELLHNASSREPFEGVAPLYRALSHADDNPFFYVSSSPWNLFDLFEAFMKIHDIPVGPILLKEMGLEDDRWLKGGHDDYKGDRIAHVLDIYPDLPFLLVGDSGQRDPFIYENVVGSHPGRILAIYIRDVSGDRRRKEIQEIAERLQDQDVDMLLMETSAAAARHAGERGWISGEQVDEVVAACDN